MSADCLFCRIVAGEIPADVVHRDERTVAFRDIAPQAPVHVLVIPTAHATDLAASVAADPAVAGDLVATAAAVARSEGVAGSGYRLIANTGGDAGQTVFHTHLHLLAGRHQPWPPG